MNINEAFPSKYLKSGDLGSKEHIVTIRSVSPLQFDNKGQKQDKLLIMFDEMEKGFAAGKLSAKVIGRLHGEETANWIGKKITLYTDPDVEYNGVIGAIRVRSQPRGNGVPSQAQYSQATTNMADWLAFADSAAEAIGMPEYHKALGLNGFEKASEAGFDNQQRVIAMEWLIMMQQAKKTEILAKHGDLLRKLNIIHA